MRENPLEVIVGAAVLLFAGAFLAYMLQVSGAGARTNGYDLTANFSSAEGISVGTDVRMAGVKVGTVTGLDLNPQTFRADMTITVMDDLQVPADSSLSVSSEGLLGGSFIEIIPGGALDNLAPGALFQDTQSAVSLITLLLRYVGGGGTE